MPDDNNSNNPPQAFLDQLPQPSDSSDADFVSLPDEDDVVTVATTSSDPLPPDDSIKIEECTSPVEPASPPTTAPPEPVFDPDIPQSEPPSCTSSRTHQNHNYKLLNSQGTTDTTLTQLDTNVSPEKPKSLCVRICDMFKNLVAITMTQMSAKKGIKKHGQDAVYAILKEYTQLHDLKVFKPQHKMDLAKDDIKDALRLITVIKEKRCGRLKGRACTDGRPQHKYISKEEAASPTVCLKSLIITLIIDAIENRDVATANIAGAFLKGIMEDFVIIKLRGKEVDILCKVDEMYKPFVIMEGGVKTLYLQ